MGACPRRPINAPVGPHGLLPVPRFIIDRVELPSWMVLASDFLGAVQEHPKTFLGIFTAVTVLSAIDGDLNKVIQYFF